MAFFKKKATKNTTSVVAPIDGELMDLSEVPDPVFSQKMMGEGIAIQPHGDIICAPMDGQIILIADTKHAFGLLHETGIEIMVHVGLDTVKLEGQGFTSLVKIGDHVKQGTPILKMDQAYMKEKNAILITPVILLNHQEHPIHFETTTGRVIGGQHVLFHVE